ncbi:MAG TPA: DUF2490 domain-containing protein [Croceibacterium sp.]
MRCTTAFSASAALLAGAWAALPARAAEEDFQLWISESVSTPLSPDTQGTLDLSQRVRENGDQLLARGTAELRLSDNAVAGGGVAYVSTIGAADEFRPHQQLTLTYGPLTLRTRVEQRFFEHADRMELRLRQRVGLTIPASRNLRAGLAGELLYAAQSQDSAQCPHVDQWRANATVTRTLGSQLEGTIGYLAILSPREGRPDRLSHVAQVSLTLRR